MTFTTFKKLLIFIFIIRTLLSILMNNEIKKCTFTRTNFSYSRNCHKSFLNNFLIRNGLLLIIKISLILSPMNRFTQFFKFIKYFKSFTNCMLLISLYFFFNIINFLFNHILKLHSSFFNILIYLIVRLLCYVSIILTIRIFLK